MTTINANYQDWSSNSTEPSAWRMCVIDVVAGVDDHTAVDIYLVRPSNKKNTFTLQLSLDDAKRLKEELDKILE